MVVALPRELEAQVAAFAKDVREAEHKGTAVIVDDYGNAHIRGAYGNGERGAFAYNKAEAERLRSLLRKAGYTLPLDTVEGLLCEALANLDSTQYHNEDMGSNAERQKRILADRRAKGFCARCPSYLARPTLAGRTLCEDCMAKETARVQAWRKRRKADTLASA
jgi:hypothetical protein